jgi:hypothetical protein
MLAGRRLPPAVSGDHHGEAIEEPTCAGGDPAITQALSAALRTLSAADNENAKLLAVRNFAEAVAPFGRAADEAVLVLRTAATVSHGITLETVQALIEQGLGIAQMRRSRPPPLHDGVPTAPTTVEALMYGLRRGLSCLGDPGNRDRLRRCDAGAMTEIAKRLLDRKWPEDVPSDPAGYKIEMPADTVMPPGFEWKFNEADPALAVARNWAHKNGLTQPQFADLLGQYAAMEAGKEAQFRDSMKGEVDKLGSNGPMRVTALQTWLNGTIGPELAKSLAAGLFSEKQVLALEKLAIKFSSQGAASFRQDGREVDRGGKGPLSQMSEEEYNATPAGERFRLSRLGH